MEEFSLVLMYFVQNTFKVVINDIHCFTYCAEKLELLEIHFSWEKQTVFICGSLDISMLSL